MPDEPPPEFMLTCAGIEPHVAAELRIRFADIGIESEERWMIQKSADQVPAWLEVIASIDTWWKLFGAGAGLYVTAIIAEAGKETVKNRKEIAKAVIKRAGSGIEKIREFVRTTSTTLETNTRTDIRVAITGDKIRFHVSLESEDDAIDTVARSVYLMQRIRKVVADIHDRVSEDDRLFGTVDVTLDDDGFTVQWVTKPGEWWETRARKYDLDGVPKGDAYRPDTN